MNEGDWIETAVGRHRELVRRLLRNGAGPNRAADPRRERMVDEVELTRELASVHRSEVARALTAALRARLGEAGDPSDVAPGRLGALRRASERYGLGELLDLLERPEDADVLPALADGLERLDPDREQRALVERARRREGA